MRFFIGAVTLAVLTACSPAIPDSGAGVGFGDYDAYQREKAAREAALAGNALPPPTAVSSEPLRTTGALVPPSDPASIAADTRAALDLGAASSDPAEVPSAVVNSVGISQENNFDAVGAERTIEEDAARIAQTRAQYQVVQPEAIGSRPGDVGPNIVAYALASNHAVGTPIYRRIGLNKDSKFARNCAQFPSPDQAQLEFLKRGGPERDRLGLDPDGDGYACNWDPSPFRNAVGG
ncbi:hypothetical protein SAMN05443999_104118 [Roseovarius azorensis]|uniref:Excalibur calcium-binding domain-containing protein n=1 Tax=Roseovarius azorensis TaxID=1287727 RepID=A0A1H7NGN3_9RHOB|nr:hypothetical protein [Roseovarius azorensis]SEL22165.1 hypothetical protein SAMN05443999_104118 [Roseovarius azorensis]